MVSITKNPYIYVKSVRPGGSRARVLFCAMVSGYDNIHVRVNIARLEKAIKYGNGAGGPVKSDCV